MGEDNLGATNRRIFAEGLRIGQRQTVLNAIVAHVTLLAYCGTVNIIILLAIASFYSTTCLLILIGIFSTLLIPAKPLLWPAFQRGWVFKTWREYFRFSYCFEEQLDLHKRYILYELPHGVFPIGPVVAATLVQNLFPDAPVYSVAADSVFHVPIWRHFMTWIGSLPASKKNFLHLLGRGTVGVVVGGIAEMFMCDKHRERVKLKERKGFIRVALEAGVDLVPVYYFGQSQVFNNYGPPFLARLSRKWRVAVGVLIGHWGLPMPRPVPIYLVHGKPIPVTKKDPSDPDFEMAVDELHAKAVNAVRDVYTRHRDEYGWPNRPLSIE